MSSSSSAPGCTGAVSGQIRRSTRSICAHDECSRRSRGGSAGTQPPEAPVAAERCTIGAAMQSQTERQCRKPVSEPSLPSSLCCPPCSRQSSAHKRRLGRCGHCGAVCMVLHCAILIDVAPAAPLPNPPYSLHCPTAGAGCDASARHGCDQSLASAGSGRPADSRPHTTQHSTAPSSLLTTHRTQTALSTTRTGVDP